MTTTILLTYLLYALAAIGAVTVLRWGQMAVRGARGLYYAIQLKYMPNVADRLEFMLQRLEILNAKYTRRSNLLRRIPVVGLFLSNYLYGEALSQLEVKINVGRAMQSAQLELTPDVRPPLDLTPQTVH
jgi:hypothetical protein